MSLCDSQTQENTLGTIAQWQLNHDSSDTLGKREGKNAQKQNDIRPNGRRKKNKLSRCRSCCYYCDEEVARGVHHKPSKQQQAIVEEVTIYQRMQQQHRDSYPPPPETQNAHRLL